MTNYGKPKKIKKDPNNIKGRGIPPNVTVSWGRGASEYRPGLFTFQYFVVHREGCCADIYHALSEEINRLNQERVQIGEKPFRRPNYSSFSRYFHWFLLLGLIERTDRRESAIYDFLQKRVFYTLTEKGKFDVSSWQDPVRAAHPEFE
jgi:hypothetical protein